MKAYFKDSHIARFVATTFLWQTVNLIFFGLFTQYNVKISTEDAGVGEHYAFFQDIHVMMFVGFGFLLVFPSIHSLSAIIFNFILSALVFQWSILTNGFWMQVTNDATFDKIQLNLHSLIDADFGVAAVLIAYGAVLGKLTPTQLLGMAFFETIFYSINLWLGSKIYCAADIGGSMVIHTFGAYFGLAVSFMVDNQVPDHATKKAYASYRSDLFALIGTLFLWMFWPSFNGALTHGGPQHRVIINTVLSLCGSCITSFIVSVLLRGKAHMADIQNATLAGGVAIGSAADLVIGSWAAILIGSVAGGVSTWGFVVLTPFLKRKFGLHDTAGIHNLHGMPGIIGGLAGIFSSLHADYWNYPRIAGIYPCRAPSNETLAALLGVSPGRDWTATDQAKFQTANLFTSIGIALGSGVIVGALIKYSCFSSKDDFSKSEYFTEVFLHVGEDYPYKKKKVRDGADFVMEVPKTLRKKKNGNGK